MSLSKFENRVFGCAIVKAINSNYNADFTHQPRMLPDGTAYATDKAFKYLVKNYFKAHYASDKILYFKSLDAALKPRSLDENLLKIHGMEKFDMKITKKKAKDGKEKIEEEVDKAALLGRLLDCLDIRLFGATYAGITNISIHGPVQVCHGVNRFPRSIIFSEQIMSPFRNSNEESDEKDATTLGSQSKLEEGHYVHHFSVNPANLNTYAEQGAAMKQDDIVKLKIGMRHGATYYDSASKAGTENELLLWVQLNATSRLVLPNFTPLVTISDAKDANGNRVIDLSKIKELLGKDYIKSEIEAIEVYYNKTSTGISGLPDGTRVFDL